MSAAEGTPEVAASFVGGAVAVADDDGAGASEVCAGVEAEDAGAGGAVPS